MFRRKMKSFIRIYIKTERIDQSFIYNIVFVLYLRGRSVESLDNNLSVSFFTEF